ncbi:MAG: DoxX family protein [Acidobacteriia bacterium]|nr:DoxX family protein [Terriglobia bacterium]
MLKRLLATADSLPLTVVRLGLGITMFPHGAQKMMGWFGGQGFGATMGSFEHEGIPAVFAFLAIAAEFFGALGLILGFLSRIAAFGVLCTMVVAVGLVHGANGFFMNWAGTQKGEGFEYHVLAIALSVAVVIGGGGDFSVDRAAARR